MFEKSEDRGQKTEHRRKLKVCGYFSVNCKLKTVD